MKEFTVSARSISGLVGLALCYSLSIYFFWNSQLSINGFKIDPEFSLITQALYGILGRENAKPIGIVLAFLSVHASWNWRYWVGDFIGRLFNRAQKATQDVRPSPTPVKMDMLANSDSHKMLDLKENNQTDGLDTHTPQLSKITKNEANRD